MEFWALPIQKIPNKSQKPKCKIGSEGSGGMVQTSSPILLVEEWDDKHKSRGCLHSPKSWVWGEKENFQEKSSAPVATNFKGAHSSHCYTKWHPLTLLLLASVKL